MAAHLPCRSSLRGGRLMQPLDEEARMVNGPTRPSDLAIQAHGHIHDGQPLAAAIDGLATALGIGAASSSNCS